MKPDFDVAVVGGGPGGSACAAICAQAGLRTVLIERARFPREKVCGDCLNPLAASVFVSLGLEKELQALSQAALRHVEFVGCWKQRVSVPLPDNGNLERGIKRSLLDELLLNRAAELGVKVRQEITVTAVALRTEGWEIITGMGKINAATLVAADGRNSTVARLLGLLPNARKDRVGLQTHLPLPADLRERVRMQFVSHGYTGIADIGGDEANLCLVSRPERIEALREWAISRYDLPSSQPWRTVTPLARAPIAPVHDRLLLVGDAARVVEPFTGEGIAYALLSGAAAGRALVAGDLSHYATEHRAIYRGRLWINHLARAACLHPLLATAVVQVAQQFPAVLSLLTSKVVTRERSH